MFKFRIVFELGRVGQQILDFLKHFWTRFFHLVILGGDGTLTLAFAESLDDILGPVAVQLGRALRLRCGG